ncbi:MAG: hypothetical protein C0485_13955 [Pirellula sp.]|nr:hypothetical protein [Pirellula sp.]
MMALVAALLSANSVSAEPAYFTGLGILPGLTGSSAVDISGDGSIVVGNTELGQAFRWTRDGGMVGLSEPGVNSSVNRISNDGSTVLGQSGNSYAYWQQQTGLTILPLKTYEEEIADLSGDGGIIAFYKHMWTQSGGLIGSPNEMHISAMSLDGKTLTGWDGSLKPASADGYIWSQQGGVKEFGPPYPEQFHLTDPHRFSANGKVVVGDGLVKPNGPFGVLRWDEQTGLTNLGLLPDGRRPTSRNYSRADISEDGSVIVGAGGVRRDLNYAWIWRESHGVEELSEVLVNEFGLASQLAGWRFSEARAVSNDGRTIVGTGQNPAGVYEAWIAHLGTPVPEPNAALLVAMTLLTTFRLRGAPMRKHARHRAESVN